MNNLPNDWPLVDPFDDGTRPAGAPDVCFYCRQKVGEPHRQDCVIVQKTVRFRCIIDVGFTEPHSWSKADIQSFHAEHGYAYVWDRIFFYLQTFDKDVHFQSCELVGIVNETQRRKLKAADKHEYRSQ